MERWCDRTVPGIPQHRNTFHRLVIFRDLAHARTRQHQCDGSVVGSSEALVDVLLNVEFRKVVVPTTGAEEVL